MAGCSLYGGHVTSIPLGTCIWKSHMAVAQDHHCQKESMVQLVLVWLAWYKALHCIWSHRLAEKFNASHYPLVIPDSYGSHGPFSSVIYDDLPIVLGMKPSSIRRKGKTRGPLWPMGPLVLGSSHKSWLSLVKTEMSSISGVIQK